MRNSVWFLLAPCLCLTGALLNAQKVASNSGIEIGMATASGGKRGDAAESKSVTLQKYTNLPLSFEQHAASEFVARGRGYAVDIRGGRATIAFPDSRVAMGVEFVHARRATATPEKLLPGKVNYILGNDPRRWRLGLSTYERVTYHDLYPGIDVAYYGNQKQLEFDLVLKPGADLRSIRMRFSGAGKLRTDPSGSLILGDLRLMAPMVIQGKKTIAARYKLLGSGEVGFEVGTYDRSQVLIIDPTLVYSTRFGGGNNFNQGSAIALDGSGNAYIAGYTYADDFPIVNAAFAGYQANGDAFISKVNSAGTALMFSTYIGGSSFDLLSGIAVDSTGAAWAVGRTASYDFPLLSPYQNALGGGNDAVVVKLSPSGSLTYSTFLGGPGEDLGNSVAVDPFGNAYVTGYASAGFPTTPGVYQVVNQGIVDAFVTKFSPSGLLVWSTFVGGGSFDYASGIAADSFGNSYITGQTYSGSFPNSPLGGAQSVNRGSGDAFVAKLNFNGSALIYFTFLGGSGYDQANAIDVDPISGIAVIAGQTASADLFPSPGAVQATNAGGYDGFVAKLNAAGSAFLYTTYLGGNRNDFLQGVAVDPNGNAYVTGYTNSNTFPTSAPVQSAMQGNSTSLFHSGNSGSSWTPFDTNIPGAVTAVLPDPVNAGTIIVSTENGIYRTVNNGGAWTQQFPASFNLSRSLANATTIYGLSGSSIYQSTDDGITWNYKGSLPLCCGSEIRADATNASTAYVFQLFSSSFGIQKTVNDGVSWSTATTGLPANAIINAMATASDGSLYVGLSGGSSPGGIYKSTNQGATWVQLTTGLPSSMGVAPLGLAVASTNPSVVYVTDFFTLYASTNGGATWSTMGLLPGGTIAIAVSSADSSTLYYGAYFSPGQLWVSTNSGGAWSQATGVGVAGISRIVPDPSNGAGAYALGQTTHEAVVAKIDSSGQNLLYSTYLGDGSYGFGVATNGTGDAFVTGYVAGFPYNPEFPVTPGALQNNRNVTDGFVARISDVTAACTYSVDPAQTLETWFTHFVQYSVTAPSGCPWTASSNQAWATIASGASGSGSGVVWVLANNRASTTQSATLTIAGQSITLRQRTVVGCGYNSFSPEASVVPGGGGTVQFNVVVGAGCEWTITNNDPTAITIVSGASGTGNGTVKLNVAPNLGPNTRTFYVPSPQGDQETISQAGTTAPAILSTITSSPSGLSITVTGNGCIPGTYTTPANLTWSANTNCTTIFTTPQFIGGTPYVFQSATVNGGGSTATNPLTVNSGTSPVTINANFMNPCTYSISPFGTGFGPQGGLGSFMVNTAPACGWSPAPSASWITILPSASQGTGKVNYSIAANSGGHRVGAITVGGQQYNIDQQAFSCSYTIAPAGSTAGASGGDSRVVVTAPAGCPWSTTSNAGWLSVTSGASGVGTGAVTVHAASNGGSARSGQVIIAGQTFSVSQTAAAQGPNACGATDVTSLVSLSVGAPLATPPAGSNHFTVKFMVTNRSGSTISGPITIVLIGLPTSSGVGVSSGGTRTTCFGTVGTYVVESFNGLPNGGSLPFIVSLVDPIGIPSFSSKVLSGIPSR